MGVGRVQVRTELAGPEGQALQLVPHASTELSATHALPQRWKPATQLKSQVPPWQIAVAFAGAVHVWHDVPHVVSESATHMLAQ